MRQPVRPAAALLVAAATFGIAAPSAGAQDGDRYEGTATYRTEVHPEAPDWDHPEDQGPVKALITATCADDSCTISAVRSSIGVIGLDLAGALPLTLAGGAAVAIPRDIGGSDRCGAPEQVPDGQLSATKEDETLTVTLDLPPYYISNNGCIAWDFGETLTVTGQIVGAEDTTDPADGGDGTSDDDATDAAAPAEGETSEAAGAGSEGSESDASLTRRQRESIAAVDRGDRSTFAASLVTPAEAASGINRTVVNLLLAGLVVLFVVFPSQLFNSTWSDHHLRIEAWFSKRLDIATLRPPRRSTTGTADRGEATDPDCSGSTDEAPEHRSRTGLYAATVVAGALIAGFLDPNLTFNVASITLIGGALLSIAVTGLLGGAAAVWFRSRRGLPTTRYVDAIPSGLAVAAICVIISRLVGFQPGYLFGLVGGLAFVTAIERSEEGRSEVVATAVALVVALVAWVLAGPVGSAANSPDANVLVQIGDAALASLFVGGLEGIMIGLIPLTAMPGFAIFRWRKTAWALLMFAITFIFFQVLLRPENGYLGAETTSSTVVTIGLFVGFGLASLLFWGYFRLRPNDPAEPEATDTDQEVEPVDLV